jgi:hypothetical protein
MAIQIKLGFCEEEEETIVKWQQVVSSNSTRDKPIQSNGKKYGGEEKYLVENAEVHFTKSFTVF